MSVMVSESRIRQIVRQMLLAEAGEPQAGATDARVYLTDIALERIAETVRKALTMREIARLEAKNREATKYTPRALPPHAAAVERLKSGDAEVVVVTPKRPTGKSPYLMITVPPDPIPVFGSIRRRDLALVKSRSRQDVVRGDNDDVLYMFETEDDMKSFLEPVVGKFGLRIGRLYVTSEGESSAGDNVYGYRAELEKA